MDRQQIEVGVLAGDLNALTNDYNTINASKNNLEYEINIYKRLLDSQLKKEDIASAVAGKDEKQKIAAVEKLNETVKVRPQEPVVAKPKEPNVEKPKEKTLEKSKETTLEKPKETTMEKPKETTMEKPKEPAVEKSKEPTVVKSKEFESKK